jgi:hypothetical protein
MLEDNDCNVVGRMLATNFSLDVVQFIWNVWTIVVNRYSPCILKAMFV